jgi:F-type H+-transporting ATPase subunit b
MNIPTIIAATETAAAEAGNEGLLQALGIDWKALLVNGIAFLILVGILGRYVYPPLIKAIDGRRDSIEKGLAEAKKSQAASQDAEKRMEAMLADARKEADEIVARGHAESTAMVAEAETKAKQRADQIVKDARAQLDADIVKARAALKKDTMQLVALATEKIVHEKLDAGKDARLVESAIANGTKGRA